MKKLVLTTLLVSGLLLGGCSAQDATKSTTETTNTTVKAEKSDREAAKEAAKKEKAEELKLSSLLPDTTKIFPDGKKDFIIGNDKDSYSLTIKNITEEQYDAFLTACKNDEWINVDVETSNSFYAYSFDNNYYLMLFFNKGFEGVKPHINISIVTVDTIKENKKQVEDADVNVNYSVEIKG